MAPRKIFLDKYDLCLKIGTPATKSTPEKITTYPLIQTNSMEIARARKSKTPILIFKSNENLYYTPCPYNLNLLGSSVFGKHICAGPKHVCERLSAADDEMGGCQKVRQRSKGIEKIKCVTLGVETINTCCDMLQVFECCNYKEAFNYNEWQQSLSYEEQKDEDAKIRKIKRSLKIFATEN